MSITIKPVSTSEQLNLCHQMQIDIFHHELKLFGMQIPDEYENCSVYMQILDSQALVGTYRIILPNTSVGLPIEQSGFQLNQFNHNRVCEMSRLVILKEKRGHFPFSKIIFYTRMIAKQNNASVVVAAILPHNVPLFQRKGFSAGEPLYDPSVKSVSTKEPIIIPMEMHI